MPKWKDSLLAILSGVLLIFAFPPFAFGWLAWFALVPLFSVVLRSSDWRSAANAGALTGLAFYPFALSWMFLVFGKSAPAFWCIFALWPALVSALLFQLRRRFKSDAALYLAGALFWAGVEYFRSECWRLNNSWMSLGFSQSPFPAAMQSASFIGVYGLSALIVAVNLALMRVWQKRRIERAEAALGLLVLACFAFGFMSLHSLESQFRVIKVALLQDESGEFYSMGRKSVGAAGDADIVVWPEDTVRFYSGKEAGTRGQLAKAITGSKALHVVGMYSCEEEDIPGDWKNQAWVMDSQGKLYGSYDKFHPIPFVEKYLKANPDPRPVDTPFGKIGIQICYDFDFENGSRIMVARGAEALIVPDYDPMAWGIKQHLQHSAMAPLRAVETGLWVARAAGSGESQIIDSHGRIVSKLDAGKFGILNGELNMRSSGTFYTHAGYRFGPLALSFVIASLLVLAWQRLKVIRNKP